jgi:hypothetical protein
LDEAWQQVLSSVLSQHASESVQLVFGVDVVALMTGLLDVRVTTNLRRR